jgi:hypothetical protein
VFDKDKKCVTLFKDIKRLDRGKWGRPFQVEFSNRGEWDIGITPAPPSYAHFYDNLTTLYDYEYHDFYNATYDITGFDVAQIIDEGGSYVGFAAFWPQLFGKMVSGTGHVTPQIVLSSLCTKEYNQTWLSLGSPSRKNITFVDGQEVNGLDWPSADPYPRGAGLWSDAPMVFKNGVLLTEGAERDYTWTGGDTDEIVFKTEPLDTDYITVVYKHQVPTGGGADDMHNYVTEPKTPYVIGEWCFDLEDVNQKRQFRAVTVYGLTDRHDGDDNDAAAKTWSNNANVIDAEVQYYLNETFNPFDLYSAVHKQESRWVKIENLTSALTAGTNYALTSGLNDQIYYANLTSEYTSLGATSPTWTRYFIREGEGLAYYPAESEWVNEFEDGIDAHSKNWALLMNGTGGYEMLKVTPIAGTPNSTHPLTLQLDDLVDFGFWWKNITGAYGPHIEIKLYQYYNGTGNAVNIAARIDNTKTATSWQHYTLNNIEDFIGGWSSDSAFQLTEAGATGLPTGEFHSFEYWTSKLGNYYVGSVGVQVEAGCKAYVDDLSVAYINKASGIRYERVYNMEEDKLIPSDWDAYCNFAEKVLINGTLAYPYRANSTFGYYNYTVNFETGNITFAQTLSTYTHLKILYSTIEENEKGRYEWMIVGKDAASIDSIGAAYMTQAFDSKKDIEVLLTGFDINATVSGPYAPFVVGGAVTGTKADYRDSLGRVHLRDDWCTTTAIASSNMLFSGGPRAQMGTEYFNEFTNAFFAREEYVTNNTGCEEPHSNKILALSCWNRNVSGAGYAVISVYQDLNGTIGFLIWGYDGQDTYYAAKWFWETGIIYLQTENRGVTDIVLKITYPTAYPTHPTVTIKERLGTISEKTPHDP